MVAVAAVVIFHPCLQARMDNSRIPVVPRSLILNRIYSLLFKPKLEASTRMNFSESRRKSTSESRAKQLCLRSMSPTVASGLVMGIVGKGFETRRPASTAPSRECLVTMMNHEPDRTPKRRETTKKAALFSLS
jgi:hypothetical protein